MRLSLYKPKKLPMVNFTLQDLMNFTQNESKMVENVLQQNEIQSMEPSESSVQNLLAYSKALSVRKSEYLKNFRLTLN